MLTWVGVVLQFWCRVRVVGGLIVFVGLKGDV